MWCVQGKKYVDMAVKIFMEKEKVADRKTWKMQNKPGRVGQKAAGRICSCGFGSQATHLLFTQRQRRPGPAAAQEARSEKAGQDGGVKASTSFRRRPEKPPKIYMELQKIRRGLNRITKATETCWTSSSAERQRDSTSLQKQEISAEMKTDEETLKRENLSKIRLNFALGIRKKRGRKSGLKPAF